MAINYFGSIKIKGGSKFLIKVAVFILKLWQLIINFMAVFNQIWQYNI